ncbi:MAG: hypothetical protein QOD02_1319 [Mycobacterium sp.]|jgi:hypothetical protein|nr:hypothetical protein [Mycobacterium sp.]
MIRMATQFAPPALLRALKRDQPLGEISVFRYPGARWRRYDKMDRFPRAFWCSAMRFAYQSHLRPRHDGGRAGGGCPARVPG